MKYIDTGNDVSRLIQLVTHERLIKTESELIYGAHPNISGMLLAILKEIQSNLYGYVLLKQIKGKITPEKESDYKYLNWRSANKMGILIFHELDNSFRETKVQ